MKTSILYILLFLFAGFTLFNGCDKVTIIPERPPLPVHKRNDKPPTPVPLGCIRGYFGDNYLTFSQHIEKVQAIDSFSNCYFYGGCPDPFSQFNLIRCDSTFVIAIYIVGYSLDSLPAALPVPLEYGKYSAIQFYPFNSYNWGSPEHYSTTDFYGESVFITDKTDDIITGTFEGTLRSSAGYILPVSGGEFKLKIFRKYMKCGTNGGK